MLFKNTLAYYDFSITYTQDYKNTPRPNTRVLHPSCKITSSLKKTQYLKSKVKHKMFFCTNMYSPQLNHVLQLVFDCNHIVPNSYQEITLKCRISSTKPGILFITDGTESETEDVLFDVQFLENTMTIKIKILPISRTVPVRIHLFSIPIYLPSPALEIDDINALCQKENIDPIVYEQYGLTNMPISTTNVINQFKVVSNDSVETSLILLNLSWTESPYQSQKLDRYGRKLLIVFSAFSIDTRKCSYWKNLFKSMIPLCRVNMISEPGISIYKIEFNDPFLTIFLRNVVLPENERRFPITKECYLRLTFSPPNRSTVTLNMNMPYFKICADGKSLEVFFPSDMSLVINTNKEITLRGKFTNKKIVGIFIPVQTHVFKLYPFLWFAQEPLKLRISCEKTVSVTEHDMLGRIFFVTKKLFRKPFRSLSNSDMKSLLTHTENTDKPFEVHFMGNCFPAYLLPELTLHPLEYEDKPARGNPQILPSVEKHSIIKMRI
uniref:U55 n=1 Tax=Human betaherpesvirus 6 TaxID=10368 RepID=A0A5P9TPN9_9BETA|nr:hypothetical protein [Human betaherpesvirus 6]